MSDYKISHFDRLMSTGKLAIEAGFSIIPINQRTKRPYARYLPLLIDDDGKVIKGEAADQITGEVIAYNRHTWKPYQFTIASANEVERWVCGGAQLAVICGKVSGGLLIIDFDAAGFFWRWYRAGVRAGLPMERLVIQRTGGGGWQVLFCSDQPGTNQKLAWVVNETQESGRSVAIETRAEGGYAVIAPSLHPSGNNYCWRRGNLMDVAYFDQAAADMLLQLARGLSQVEDAPSPPRPPAARRSDLGDSERVIDRYNERTDIHDVLIAAGYADTYGKRMHRPGYEATSEPSVDIVDNRSWHWSSNDPLSDGYWKTPFAARLYYEFHGDLDQAVETLRDEFGLKRPEPVMAEGVACCPHHIGRELRMGNKSGYYCSAKTDDGYCGFYWAGDGYTPPTTAKRTPYRVQDFKRYQSAAVLTRGI